MKKTNLTINSFTSILMQGSALIQGLLIPRLILSTFGSDINGLSSSINQFLNFFAVFEGGISGVILSALYRPFACGDNRLLGQTVRSGSDFLKKLTCINYKYIYFLSIFFRDNSATCYSG